MRLRPSFQLASAPPAGPPAAALICLVASVAVAVAGCSRQAPAERRPALDLVGEFPHAIHGVETRAIDFGTPAARSHLTSGWSPDQVDGRGPEPYVRSTAWSSELSFYVVEPANVRVTLDLRPLRSTAPGGVELSVALNGEPLQQIELKPKRRQARLRLPAARLTSGSNWLHFAYRQLDAAAADRRPVVHWYRLTLDRAGDAAAPAPRADADSGVLFLPYGTEVTYPVRLPADSILRAEHLRFAGDAAGRLEIHLTSDEDGEVELAAFARGEAWSDTGLTAASPRLALLRLAARGDGDGDGDGGEAGVGLRAPWIWSPEPPLPRARPAAAGRRPPPNVIIYMIDTLRADRLGCYGYARPLSPRIDEFAAGATLFENAVGQSSWTRASVATLFTGLWPAAHGAVGRLDRLADEAVTLAEAMRAEGYQTAAVVTNHNVHRTFGFDQGFDAFVHTNKPKTPSDLVNAYAESWLDERDPHQPFLLYLHTIDPHNPYLAPERFRRRFAPGTEELVARIESNPRGETWDPSPQTIAGLNALYDAEIAFNDESFGALVDLLRERGLWDDALVVVVSDHGEEFYEHGRWSHGKDLHVETLNVPLIVKLPGQRRGQRRGELVQHQDVMPTVLDYLGVDVSAVVQGESFLPLLQAQGGGDGTPGRRPDAYSHLKLDGPLHLSLVTAEWKLIRSYGSRGGVRDLLYRWREDPREERDLAGARPVTAAVLAALLEAKLREPGVRLEGGEAELSPELEQQLRALGYLQ